MNGATCTDAVNAYTCACVAGYTGPHCETGESFGIVKVLHLYNKGNTRNLERDGIILAEFGSTRRFVDLLRWTH